MNGSVTPDPQPPNRNHAPERLITASGIVLDDPVFVVSGRSAPPSRQIPTVPGAGRSVAPSPAGRFVFRAVVVAGDRQPVAGCPRRAGPAACGAGAGTRRSSGPRRRAAGRGRAAGDFRTASGARTARRVVSRTAVVGASPLRPDRRGPGGGGRRRRRRRLRPARAGCRTGGRRSAARPRLGRADGRRRASATAHLRDLFGAGRRPVGDVHLVRAAVRAVRPRTAAAFAPAGLPRHAPPDRLRRQVVRAERHRRGGGAVGRQRSAPPPRRAATRRRPASLARPRRPLARDCRPGAHAARRRRVRRPASPRCTTAPPSRSSHAASRTSPRSAACSRCAAASPRVSTSPWSCVAPSRR